MRVRPEPSANLMARVAREGALNTFKSVALVVLSAVSTPILIRKIGGDSYGLLSLALSVTGYVALAEFGIQADTSRQVAVHQRADDAVDVEISRAFWILAFHGVLALVGFFTVFAVRRTLFSSVAPNEYHAFDRSLLILGVASCVSLPSAALMGYLNGTGRVGSAGTVQVISRLVSVGVAIALAFMGFGAPGVALALAFGLVVTFLLSMFAVVRERGLRCLRRPRKVRSYTKKTPQSITLFVWMAATTVITGADPIIVSMTDHTSLGFYSLASQLNGLVVTVLGGLLLPLIPALAIKSQHDSSKLLEAMYRLSSGGILAMAVAMMLVAPFTLRILGGRSLGDAAITSTVLLLSTTMIRQLPAPLALYSLNGDNHFITRAAAVVEAVVNITASVFLGYRFGAKGVAIGTVIGGFSSLAFYSIAGFPGRFRSGRNSRFWVSTTLRMWGICLPFVGLATVDVALARNPVIRLIAAPVAAAMLFFFGLTSDDRRSVYALAAKVTGRFVPLEPN